MMGLSFRCVLHVPEQSMFLLEEFKCLRKLWHSGQLGGHWRIQIYRNSNERRWKDWKRLDLLSYVLSFPLSISDFLLLLLGFFFFLLVSCCDSWGQIQAFLAKYFSTKNLQLICYAHNSDQPQNALANGPIDTNTKQKYCLIFTCDLPVQTNAWKRSQRYLFWFDPLSLSTIVCEYHQIIVL